MTEVLGDLPDPMGTRVLLIGSSDFSELDDLPAVAGNLIALRDLFREIWNLPAAHCTVISNPVLPRDVSHAVRRAVSEATDTLLIYYAGHGLIEPRNGQLHLAIEGSDPKFAHDSAVPYQWIRWEVEQSPATRRIVVLDCCYGARAFGAQSATAALEVDGTYLLAAAAETAVALSPPGEPLTAFTGEWITVLREGVPNGSELLSLDTVFTRLRTRLVTRNRPEPQRLCRNQLGQAAFARNPAYVPADPVRTSVGGAVQGTQPMSADLAIADIYTARSLADSLQAIADGVISGFGYGLAVVNLVRPDGDLVVAAVAGSTSDEAVLAGRVGSRDAWERRLTMGKNQDGLCFIPHVEGWTLDHDDVPELPLQDAGSYPAGGWNAGDRLYAPMTTSDSELIGVLSMDRPRHGRHPDPEIRKMLLAYAFHATIAISNARLRANMQRALVRLEREQQALRASEESFRQAFEYAPSGIAMTEMGGNQHGRILRANDALCRLLGRPASAMRRYSFSDLVHPEDIGTLLRTSAEGGRAELRLARRDGTYRWCSLRTSVVADADDGPRFLLAHVEDIEQRKLREAETTYDALTGLLSEAGLRDRLGERLCVAPTTPADRTGMPASLVSWILSPDAHVHRGEPGSGRPTLAVLRYGIDGFKGINTSLGHEVGDGVLVEFAHRLRGSAPDGCDIARVRGDEYVVLGEDLGQKDAGDLADRIHGALRGRFSLGRGNGVTRLDTTSVLSWAACGTSADQVLARTVELLYDRKRLR